MRDWTQGSIFQNLISLAGPIIISSSFNILGPVIDMVWVGRLGAASIAGVGIASMTVMAITSARMGLTMGTRAIVARFIGSGDLQGANHVAQQAFVISGVYVVIIASLGMFFAGPIMKLFGVEADVVSEGADYMRIMFIGSIAMSFRMMAEGIMQASGDAVIPMRVTIFFRILHAVLSPFLIFGLWIFPQMGVSGAATANVLSQGLGAVISFWILFTGRSRLKMTLRNFSLDFSIIWRIVKIGIPGAIMSTERAFGDMVLMWFMAPFGTIAVASHALIQRVEAVLRMPCMGLGNGSGVLVGQNLGAGKPERAAKSGWMAAGLAQIYALIIVAVIFLWSESIISVFNSDPEIVATGSAFLRIAATGYLFMGLYFVLQNSINGSGDTMPAMLVTLLNFWLIQVPLAYFIPKYTDLDANGVRWAIVIGWIVGAIAYAVYFKLGRWKRKSI